MIKRDVFNPGIVKNDRGLGLASGLAKEGSLAPIRFHKVE